MGKEQRIENKNENWLCKSTHTLKTIFKVVNMILLYPSTLSLEPVEVTS